MVFAIPARPNRSRFLAAPGLPRHCGVNGARIARNSIPFFHCQIEPAVPGLLLNQPDRKTRK